MQDAFIVHGTVSVAAILLVRGSLFLRYASFRPSGLAVVMPCVIQRDQNLFPFGKLAFRELRHLATCM